LHPKDLPMLPEAFKYYNAKPPHERKEYLLKNAPFKKVFEDLKKTQEPKNRGRVLIKMIGVWDTVGALGPPVPIQWVKDWTKKKWVGFYNTELGGHAEYAYHAVAIDERRGPFKPNLWTGSKTKISDTETTETKDVCQVWFPGSHSNVGGGARDTQLSDETLLWMIKRAQGVGLYFKDDKVKEIEARKLDGQKSNPENSFRWIYQVLKYFGVPQYIRGSGEEGGDPAKMPVNQMIHESGSQKFMHEENAQQNPRYPSKNTSQKLIHQLPVFRETDYKMRGFPRLPLQKLGIDGIIEVNGNRSKCEVVDFSREGGAGLHCDERQYIKGEIAILSIPDGEHSGEYPSEVVWGKESSLGLRFHKKRDSLRLPLQEHGIIEVNGSRCKCEVVDFSREGGAGLHCDEPQYIKGENVILSISEGEHSGEYPSQVVWENGCSLGLRFDKTNLNFVQA
jgi:hypothetical protein